MHEVSIARQLLSRAEKAAAEAGADRVDGLTVAVGEATHLNPTQLGFAIETVAEDTLAAGATVDVETVPPYATCECGWEGAPEELDSTYIVAPNVTCPECGGRLEFEQGEECRLETVSVPDEPDGETTPT
ncbi:MAG: hydrogenase maturation nickel metallochaperone HypA [Halobacteriales archaeon]